MLETLSILTCTLCLLLKSVNTRLFIVLCLKICLVTSLDCMFSNDNGKVLRKEGDIILGGLYPIHFGIDKKEESFKSTPELPGCTNFYAGGLQWAMGMVFAVNEINENSSLLPRTTLGYAIYDSCFNMPKTVETSLKFMKIDSVHTKYCTHHVIVGTFGSTLAVMMARLFGLYSIPQVSYASSCKCLSDKSQFPSFLRTLPNAKNEATALAFLVQHFNWLYVGAIAVDDDYGRPAAAQFVEEVEQNGVCIAFQEVLPQIKDAEAIFLLVVHESKANAVLVYSTEIDFLQLADEFLKCNLTGKSWIASDAWIKSHTLTNSRYAQLFEGTMGFHFHQGKIQGLENFLINIRPGPLEVRESFSKLWERTFDCTWDAFEVHHRICTGSENLSKIYSPFTEVTQVLSPYTTHLAVYSIAYGLHDLQSCQPGEGPFQNNSCTNISNFQPWQLVYYIRNVRFIHDQNEVMYFDENGDPPAKYDLYNWQGVNGELEMIVVGYFESIPPLQPNLFVNSELILWADGNTKVPISICSEPCKPGTRKAALVGEPFCCFDCIPCNEGEYSNTTDSQDCFRCQKYFGSTSQRDYCITLPEEFLEFSDPIAVPLLALSVLGIVFTLTIMVTLFWSHKQANDISWMFGVILVAVCASFSSCWTFAGRPINSTCQMQKILVSFSLTLMISCLMSIILQLCIKSGGNPLIKTRKFINENTVIYLFLTPQFAFDVVWSMLGFSHINYNTNDRPGNVILECVDSSIAWSICALAYLVILFIICCSLATQAQTYLPSLREPKFITFYMYFCILVTVAFIPAYITTQGKFTVATEIFAVLVINYGLIVSLFLPKCYNIIIKNK
uniref:G-protein coupled receptors family 3 profile domain-containing protein n=1 Tax=Eptatretus burgeri TaxID=7764 RepID=A0A8C4QW70_EPTBU